MLGLFIMGLIAGAAIAAVAVVLLNLKWFLNYAKSRIQEFPQKNVVFVDIRNIYNDLRQKNRTVTKNKNTTNNTVPQQVTERPVIEAPIAAAEEPPIAEDSPIAEAHGDNDNDPLKMLEDMCSDSPYVAAEYDKEADTISDYEAIKPEQTDDDFLHYMKDNDGLVLVGA